MNSGDASHEMRILLRALLPLMLLSRSTCAHKYSQFVHIPKTGGSYVEDVSWRFYGVLQGKEIYDHRLKNKLPWNKISKDFKNVGACSWWHIPPRYFDDFRTNEAFAILRDPVERAWSEARYVYTNIKKEACDARCLNAYISRELTRVNKSHAYENSGINGDSYFGNDCHWIPQYMYFTDRNNALLKNMRVVCYEKFDGESFLRDMYKKREIPQKNMHRFPVRENESKHVMGEINETLADKIRKLYRNDVEWHNRICRT
eukprot:gene431-793_t